MTEKFYQLVIKARKKYRSKAKKQVDKSTDLSRDSKQDHEDGETNESQATMDAYIVLENRL
jgi:hypothetical protein